MIVREAEVKDISELVDMSVQLLTYELFYDENLRKPSENELYDFWNRTVNNKRCVVLVAEKKNLVGYVYGWFMRDYFIFRKPRAYISDLFVKPEFRRRGIGTLLVNELLKYFRENGVKFVYVDVYSRNDSALRFWEKNGFDTESVTLVKKL